LLRREVRTRAAFASGLLSISRFAMFYSMLCSFNKMLQWYPKK
jgi:hypothetical protein